MLAEESSATFRKTISDLKTAVTYATNVVEATNALAVERGARAVAFRPRGGSDLRRLISGDKALRLVTDTEPPVIALHDAEEGEQ